MSSFLPHQWRASGATIVGKQGCEWARGFWSIFLCIASEVCFQQEHSNTLQNCDNCFHLTGFSFITIEFQENNKICNSNDSIMIGFLMPLCKEAFVIVRAFSALSLMASSIFVVFDFWIVKPAPLIGGKGNGGYLIFFGMICIWDSDFGNTTCLFVT